MSISILSDVDGSMNNGDNVVIRMSALQDNPYRENLSIEDYIKYLDVYTIVEVFSSLAIISNILFTS